MKRTTTRFNDQEEAELELLKKTFKIQDDSKAIKLAIEWVNSYLRNVTQMFFPPSFDVVLYKKTKTYAKGNRVYDEK